jgi:hypothetical protein
MNNWQFFMPYAYFLSTRVVTPAARLSWVLIYFVPLGLTHAVFTPAWSGEALNQLLLAATAVYALYELGYLENDTVTVQHEVSPTVRLSESQTAYVAENLSKIVTFRLGVGISLILFISAAAGITWFLVGMLLLGVTFAIYNRTRGKFNALLHPILVSLRFSLPVLVVLPELEVLLFLLLVFPLLNSLERAAEPRYGITWLQTLWLTNQASSRWLYYLLLMLLTVSYLPLADQSPALLIPVCYMFIYRLATAYIRPHKVVS